MRYHQFCPVSKAAEILGERWNILILRELLCGSRRFNDIQRGLGGISPSLLTRRLKELEAAGMLTRQIGTKGSAASYLPTAAGEALTPVIVAIGDWGMRYARGDMTDDEMDLDLLMVDIQRRLVVEHIPARKATLHFRFTDQEARLMNWWIRLDGDQRELCTERPAEGENLTIKCPATTMAQVWTGDLSLSEAQASRALSVVGDEALINRMRQWIGLSVFTPERRAERGH